MLAMKSRDLLLYIMAFLSHANCACVTSPNSHTFECDVMIDGHLPGSLYLGFKLCRSPPHVETRLDIRAVGIHSRSAHELQKTLEIPVYGVGVLNVKRVENGTVEFAFQTSTQRRLPGSLLGISLQTLVPDCVKDDVDWLDFQRVGILLGIGVVLLFILIMSYGCCMYQRRSKILKEEEACIVRYDV